MMRINLQRLPLLLMCIVCLLLITSTVLAITLGSADGVWSNAVGEFGYPPSCLNFSNSPGNTSNENLVTYGSTIYDFCPVSASRILQSGFGFLGAQSVSFTPGEPFLLGQLNHYNNPLFITYRLQQVTLSVNLTFTDPALTTAVDFVLELDETTNLAPCQYPGETICPDRLSFEITTGNQTFEINNTTYTLEILGFEPGTLQTCSYTGGSLNQFISEEQSTNTACLFAQIQVAEPDLSIVKTGSTGPVAVGESITYQITVTNTGNVPLTGVVVNDDVIGLVNYPIGNLGIGQNRVLNVSHSVTMDDLPGPVINIATADSDQTGPVSDSHTVPIIGPPGTISVTKQAGVGSVAEPGANVTFTAVITNTSTANLVTITQVVDDRVGDVSGSCQPGLPKTLSVGESLTCTYNGFVGGSGGDVYTNTVTASGHDMAQNPVSGSASASVNVTGAGASDPDPCEGQSPDPQRDLNHEDSHLNHPFDNGTIVNRSSCFSYDVGIASYRRVDEHVGHQILHDFSTTTIAPGQTLTLTVGLPECAVQVDLFYGALITDLSTGRYNERLLDSQWVGSALCSAEGG